MVANVEQIERYFPVGNVLPTPQCIHRQLKYEICHSTDVTLMRAMAKET